jgi:plastocyanin
MIENIIKKFFLIMVLVLFIQADIADAGNITGLVTRGKKNVDNAVIYVDLGKNLMATDKRATMNQENLTFIPHVLPVQAGTTVDFLNSDDVLHNVFSSDECSGNFNLGSYPKGEHRSYTFNNPGCVVTILCNVHPEMEAYIVTVGTPYFTQSVNGSYQINDVPAGTYTIHVWHESYGSTSLSITVPDTGEIVLNIKL